MHNHILLISNMFRTPLWPSYGILVTRIQLIHNNGKKCMKKPLNITLNFYDKSYDHKTWILYCKLKLFLKYREHSVSLNTLTTHYTKMSGYWCLQRSIQYYYYTMYTWLLVAIGHHLAHSQTIGHQFIMCRTQQSHLHDDFTTYMFNIISFSH